MESDSSSGDELTFGADGLLPAVAQDHLTGQVRMVGFMNREALAETLRSGKATFFSRSRQRLWTKGESSGNVLHVQRVVADCDADTLLLMVEPEGPTCHTGAPSCFFRTLTNSGDLEDQPVDATPFLHELERTLVSRKASTSEKSYTKSLLSAGASRIGEKLHEEAAELSLALAEESNERVAAEAADVLYHLMVGLVLREVPLRAVIEALCRRTQQSGHEEKRSR